MNQFYGTGVALATPFNDDYTIDYNGLEKLIDTAKDVKLAYTPDNQRPVTDDDPDF